MKAAVFHEFGGVDKLRVEGRPDPVPGPTDALVRVRACGVNRLDLMVRSGATRVKLALPHIGGCEIAGEVVALGDAASTDVRPGQAVAVAPYLFCGRCEYCLAGEETTCLRGDIVGLSQDGGFAELARVPAANLVALPDGVSYDAGAAVSLATLTAWHMLVTRARLRAGEDVLVLAAGSGIGSAAIQIARLLGARVIATASTAEKRARARELGAQETIDYQNDDLLAEVRRLTNKRGVDVVVEHVGAATWEKSVAALARNGRLVTCGTTSGAEGKLDLWSLFAKQLNLIGCYGGSRAELKTILRLVADGRLTPTIHASYDLEGVATAQSVMVDRQQFGKLVIRP
ncbi:MAG: zinc-binding dehydrogenase [Chloroflexota bacterium]